MSLKQTDPIILTAVCTFALDVFESRQVKENEEVMEPFYVAIGNMLEVLPILGGNKYM